MLDQGQTVIIYKSPTVMPPKPAPLPLSVQKQKAKLARVDKSLRLSIRVKSLLADGRERTASEIYERLEASTDTEKRKVWEELNGLLKAGKVRRDTINSNINTWQATQ